jgi:hypothetical protein
VQGARSPARQRATGADGGGGVGDEDGTISYVLTVRPVIPQISAEPDPELNAVYQRRLERKLAQDMVGFFKGKVLPLEAYGRYDPKGGPCSTIVLSSEPEIHDTRSISEMTHIDDIKVGYVF